MKKTNFLILILIIELLVVISTITFKGTYAKYITAEKGSDSARVAHWNINTTNNIKDLFAASYTNVVDGTEEQGVIAPGTSGSYSFTIDGDVETSYTLSIVASGTDNVNGAISGYNPIKYSFTKPNTGEDKDVKPTLTIDGMTFEELKKAINDIDNGSQIHKAGNLSGDIYTIGWKWEIDGDNEKDTLLGNLVSRENRTINLSVDIVVTQVN